VDDIQTEVTVLMPGRDEAEMLAVRGREALRSLNAPGRGGGLWPR
jgi:hypothetical protein